MQAFFRCLTVRSFANCFGVSKSLNCTDLCSWLWTSPFLRLFTRLSCGALTQKFKGDVDGNCNAQRAALAECGTLAVCCLYCHQMCFCLVATLPLCASELTPQYACPIYLCSHVQAKKPNVRNTINYHLQRLSRRLR